MAPKSAGFECTECGARYSSWVGKCGKCKKYSTLEEISSEPVTTGKQIGLKTELLDVMPSSPLLRVHEIDPAEYAHHPTGIGEFDRVFGGGLVTGQAVLLAGEPGVGKSTLLLEVADSVVRSGGTVLVVSGEESAQQIKLRADRIGVSPGDLYIVSTSNLSVIVEHVQKVNPTLLIVDSVQTIGSPEVSGVMGGVAQVSEVAGTLVRLTKQRNMSLILIGQVTKEGQIAGPESLSHLVDSLAHLNGDKNTPLRLLRIEKNRFGPADEVACFAHDENGLQEVPDPSGLFATQRDKPVPGTCVTVTMEGRRPLLAEVQALVAPTNSPNPRRGVSGLDAPRAQMLMAVTERHGGSGIRMYDKDAYVATIAGMRIVEPAVDLALCIALASAALDAPVPLNMCAIGEVTLSGDLRQVPNMNQRLNEAARLGFSRVIVPKGTKKPTGANLVLIHVSHVSEALKALRAAQEG